LSISTPRLNKMIVADWSVFKQFEDRNVHVLLGHQFNWEIANLVCQLNTRHPFYGIYLPLSSPAFDRLMNHIRSRTGSKVVNAKEFKSDIKALKSEYHILGVIADQSAANMDSSYWYTFLNRTCPF